MKKKRSSFEQIIGILKQAELGTRIADLCRQHGVSERDEPARGPGLGAR